MHTSQRSSVRLPFARSRVSFSVQADAGGVWKLALVVLEFTASDASRETPECFGVDWLLSSIPTVVRTRSRTVPRVQAVSACVL